MITTTGLSKHFQDHEVLKSINIEVAAQDIVVVL